MIFSSLFRRIFPDGYNRLVTDFGGILAHGSIVAREYDIPAVLGTGIATKRIKRRQMIGVDGDAGVVTLLAGE